MTEWKKDDRAITARYEAGQRRVAWDSESRGTYRIGARAKKAERRARKFWRRRALVAKKAALGRRYDKSAPH